MRAIALALMLTSASACATLSSGPTTQSPESQLVMQVPQQPPPDKDEGPHAAAPGFGFIWVAGYWDYLDGNYIWRQGRWVQGKPDYEYVRARYEFDGKSWVFHRPHWKRRHSDSPRATAQR